MEGCFCDWFLYEGGGGGGGFRFRNSRIKKKSEKISIDEKGRILGRESREIFMEEREM